MFGSGPMRAPGDGSRTLCYIPHREKWCAVLSLLPMAQHPMGLSLSTRHHCETYTAVSGSVQVENGLRLLLDNIQRVASSHSASKMSAVSACEGPQTAVESLVARDPKERLIYQYVSVALQPVSVVGSS